jgi:hypothetical protein
MTKTYTALNLEFEDSSLASFRLTSTIAFSFPPEIAKLKGGHLVGWKKLKQRPAVLELRDRNV